MKRMIVGVASAFALALVAAPSAMATEDAPTGPDSVACAEATEAYNQNREDRTEADNAVRGMSHIAAEEDAEATAEQEKAKTADAEATKQQQIAKDADAAGDIEARDAARAKAAQARTDRDEARAAAKLARSVRDNARMFAEHFRDKRDKLDEALPGLQAAKEKACAKPETTDPEQPPAGGGETPPVDDNNGGETPPAGENGGVVPIEEKATTTPTPTPAQPVQQVAVEDKAAADELAYTGAPGIGLMLAAGGGLLALGAGVLLIPRLRARRQH